MKKYLVVLFLFLFFLVSLCLSGYSPKDKTTKALSHKDITITIDLCPSSKPYEKKLFDYLDQLGKKQGKPVPVAIAVSGNWLLKHEADLKEIKSKYLDITWVNHSLTHPVDDGFLDNPKVDFKREVMGNNALMKRYGLKPSKYFRFPGLVRNQQRLKELSALGFVNLDADTWLGKGQVIKDGSIVLIHGNGNEAPGVVEGFIDYLKANHNQTRFKKLA